MIQSVPFFRPSIGERELTAVSNCLRSGWLTTGPCTAEFEKKFSQFLGDENLYSIAVNSATAGLHLALEACQISPGDEVIVPTLTFTATAEVVRYLGATPVFVDIDPDTLCLCLNDVSKAITPKTRAVMPVHFAGIPCDLTSLRALAESHDIAIIEDAAHALPASHANQAIGTSGSDATVFSFYANKTMTTGEGGMLVTRKPDIAARAKIMRLHGINRDVFNRFTDTRASWVYDVVAPGFKYNMTDMTASLGIVQLSRVPEFHKIRSTRARIYNEKLQDLPLTLPPQAATDDIHSWHLYIIQLTEAAPLDRDELAKALQESGIGISVHYRPLHQMQYWSTYCSNQKFPKADAYSNRCLSLPLFMDMSDDEQSYVIDTLHKILL